MIDIIKPELKPFHLAASYTIGSHILPGETINTIQKILQGKLKLTILPCNEIIAGIKEGTFDLGLIESPLFDSSLIYKEWIEDELVICSKKPLASSLGEEELKACKLICRKEGSLTRNFITDFLKKCNLSYESFNSLSEIDNATAMIQSVKWAKPNVKNPTIAIMSQLAIQNELKYNELYQSRICNNPMIRKFHLIYSQGNQDNRAVNHIINQLMKDVF
ncbi:hypothetical protein KKC13_06950 [bacterium]|nr:hypothetical protein [bacterium]MBU1959252.1 hypothetical protein [bacterium]